ncbi:hypothetical protein ACFO4O_04405 [Glaciecola siphonariae]|uniref:Uncharacterized protein n=1 Tax=Glaciecola siphonariae TaxID=521012 RepID=A0ABV9LUU6_9ALTE
MSLSKFVKSKTGTHAQLLALAKAETVTNGKLIHRDTMNSLLASAGLYVAFKAMAEDSTNPFQNLIAAFLDSQDFNFIQSSATGQRQIAALDQMISTGGDLGTALGALKPVIIKLANPTVPAFPSVTLHDIRIALGDETRLKQIGVFDGIANITVDTTKNAGFEEHRPQVYFKINGIYERRAGFALVEESGVYNAQCPTPSRSVDGVFVDDSYGVVL